MDGSPPLIPIARGWVIAVALGAACAHAAPPANDGGVQVAALKWLQQSNATLPHDIDANLALESLLGASRIPLTVRVDARGRVVDKVHGAREWDSPESVQRVQRAFRAAARPAAR